MIALATVLGGGGGGGIHFCVRRERGRSVIE